MHQRIEKPMGENRRAYAPGGPQLCSPKLRIPKDRGHAGQQGPHDGRDKPVRIGEDKLGLVRYGEGGGDGYGLPTTKNKEPEYEVEKECREDERAKADAPFCPPDGQCCADVTCEHPDLPAKRA
jgi:hypothetical protein